jgi:hypothetical protein
MSSSQAGPSNATASSSFSGEADRPITFVPDLCRKFMYENYPATHQAAVDFNSQFGHAEDASLPSFFDLPEVEFWDNYTPPDPTPTLYSQPQFTGYTYPLLFDFHERSFRDQPYTYASGLDLWCSIFRIRRVLRKLQTRAAEAPSDSFTNALLPALQGLSPFLVSFRLLTSRNLLTFSFISYIFVKFGSGPPTALYL